MPPLNLGEQPHTNDDEWRKALLRDYNISYLFYGPRERALLGFEPGEKPYLVESYANRLVTIYRVVIEGG